MSGNRKPRIVLANGVFDVLHVGHVAHLQEAARLGDLLVVSITADAQVNKGPGRPIFPDHQRARVVRALGCVDDVLIVSGLTEALEKVRPDIVVKGIDYALGLQDEHTKYCRDHGIEIAFTDTPKYSASDYLAASERARCGTLALAGDE